MTVRPSDDTTRSRRADVFGTWAAAVVAGLALAALQLSFAGLYDLDSYFHARASLDLAKSGVQTEFPQAAFSTWADAYSDKDFLFHALTAPFVSESSLVSGGKWAIVFFDLVLFLAVAWTIRTLDLRFGALWLLLLVAASPYYVTRFVPLRPHTLGLAFIAVEIGLLARDRWKPLLVVAALHVWAHSSFPLVFALYGIRVVVALGQRTAIPVAPGIALMVGMAAATLLHPYFPNNLHIAYAQIFRLAGHLWGGGSEIPVAAFGSELRPVAPRTLLLAAPGWVPAALSVLVTLAVRGRRGWSTRDVFLLLVTLAFLALTVASRRFLDMFILASALLAGALWTTLADGRTIRELWATRRVPAGACGAVVAASLAYGLFATWTELPARFQNQSYGDVFLPTIERLDALAAPDDVVYHPSWREFAVLYGFRPAGRYIAGLDPVFLHEKHPRLFMKSWRLSRGAAQKPHRLVAGQFGARWVFVTTEKRFVAFRRLMARTPGFRRVWQSDVAEIWEVAPLREAPSRGQS